MLAPWVGLHLKRTPKDAEATHATHTSTLGNQESVLAGGDPNHFGAPPASFC
jgi:precorrin-6B methylase 1